jgi:drug/metabolite transporter (DMT)-like permease
MDITPEILAQAHHIIARANSTTTGSSATHATRPPIYKAVGLILAISSGVFIGISFVLKKTGLLKANAKYNEEAGEGYGYLKNAYWWTGMTLMIIGEICNFVAYAFVDAILVTPLGALSVVITTILSAIFLKERLSFVGKIGCFNCIIGSVVIVMNAPTQSSVATIQEMKHFVIAPGFLSYAGVIIVGCAFIALWVGPRYGKKSMLVYLSICSLIGGLSVVATQGLGAAVVAQAGGTPQFNQWFLYVLLVFVVTTLITEIIFLNVSTEPGDRNGGIDKVCRKLSIYLMRHSSHQRTTFSSRAQRLSHQLFSSKVSRVHQSVLPPSSWGSSKFVLGSCYCNCPNLRKTCPMRQSSRVISTR